MWIFMNDGYFSIVQHEASPQVVLVRSRVKGDIERVFEVPTQKVLKTPTADYMYRAFLPKQRVAKKIAERVLDIDYTNFKNSVEDEARHTAYTGVWHVMFKWQENTHPDERYKWWQDYKYLQERYGYIDRAMKDSSDDYVDETDGQVYDVFTGETHDLDAEDEDHQRLYPD